MKTALCCIAKCENLYLDEWVSYHLDIGFDHVYIYDNNDADGERCADAVPGCSGKVTVLKYFIGVKQSGCETQVAAYNDFYRRFARKYDWVLYIDVDEFLVLRGYPNVRNYLSAVTRPSVYAVELNWVCYSDGGNLHYEPLPVRDRFTEACEDPELGLYRKHFYRMRVPGFRMLNVHYGSQNGVIVDCEGNTIEHSLSVKSKKANTSVAYIAHYATKSADEYVSIKKRRRGAGIGNDRLSIDHYFKFNERTAEKEEYLGKLFREGCDGIVFSKRPVVSGSNENVRVAVCAIAKKENLYIREWVGHHKNIGVDKVFIYDNNDVCGERIEDEILDYVESGFVTVFDVRGEHKKLDKKFAEATKYHGIQQDCFEECFRNNRVSYDWMCFIDIDEFLCCGGNNIKAFLSNCSRADVVLLNWVTYGDNGLLVYDGRFVQDRFPEPSSKRQYTHVKSVLNCSTHKKIVRIDAHLSVVEDGVYIDSAGNAVEEVDYKKEIVVDNCYIKHYLTKTIEEWVLRKYKNTSATGKDYFNEAFEKRIKEFFTFNEDTVEKREVIDRTVRLMDSSDSDVVVSLTSFGERLRHDAYVAMSSILSQTVKPKVICLTIFNEDAGYIPSSIMDLIDFGLVDLIVSDINLKPHLKYFYAMQKYRDCNIITVDDDHIYEDTMVEKLLETHRRFPTCVAARRCHNILRNDDGSLMPYKKWNFEYDQQTVPGSNLFATGVGGVLYPPDILEIDDTHIPDILKCLNADDIYLKWLETKLSINVVWSPNQSFCGKVIKSEYSSKNRLQDENWMRGGNDEYLKLYSF